MQNKEELKQKIKFYKRYMKHLVRISIGSLIATLLFIYIMDAVNIDLASLKISIITLIFLASLPTIIPLTVLYLMYKQLQDLKETLKNL